MKITFTRRKIDKACGNDKLKSLEISVSELQNPQEINQTARNIYNIASVCERTQGTPIDVIGCMKAVKQLAAQIIESIAD